MIAHNHPLSFSGVTLLRWMVWCFHLRRGVLLIVPALAPEPTCAVMWRCFKSSEEEEVAPGKWLQGEAGIHGLSKDLKPSALGRTDCPQAKGVWLC